MPQALPNLKDLDPPRLRERLAAGGVAPYRADQILAWLYARGVDDPREMTDLALDLRERLAAEWRTRALETAVVRRSADGTRKAVLRAADGAQIESVLIPDDDRVTLCLSTQVGCPLACSFCATGAMGFTRNLTTAEIVDQVCRMRETLGPGERITNVVFMGMGEPLLNLPAVLRAIGVLVHPRAFALAGRRITVSTAGLVPKIRPLLEGAPVNLAVSLHATTDALRDALVPLNRRFPLAALLGELRSLEAISPRRPVFFEYTLLGGVNDAPADAERLLVLLRGLPSKVNVIPVNPHPGSSFRAPAMDAIDRFLGVLARGGMTVTLRRSRGADIDAACGQLAARAEGGSRTPSPNR
ncbi:MAG: 23S rRNA (adenine(2503)-C(2))-methyltransferase RlmN [Deltaproteobacteria bacterium]|nr:23S rRNA (adenine(2503)-C(2))-methyltransferase RlmN [Deltaproteobacteria bacterium]